MKSLDLDPDPEFSNDLDPDPDSYSERPGSRLNIIAPKSYLSKKTSKIFKLFLGGIRIPIRTFLVDPDTYFQKTWIRIRNFEKLGA